MGDDPRSFSPAASAAIACANEVLDEPTDRGNASFGVVREADEGIAAHLWQMLLAGQLPIVAFFAIRWLPRSPGQALPVLALQAGAGLAALAPVYFLGL